MSDWIEITGNTDIGDLPDHLMTDLGLLRSRFVATAWPVNPVPGQPCVRSDRGYRAYTYTNDPLLGEAGWVEDALLSATVLALKAELEAARGTASNLGARLSVAMNPDGSLKDPAPAGSWWATEADAVAYASATTFTAAGDKTGVYTAGRALHLVQTASGYGYVVSSTYASGTGLTTVTVRGVAVDSGLDQIEYSSQVEAMPYGVATSSNKGVVQLGIDVPRFIASNASFYIGPSGSDATGDGSSGNPYLTLAKVFSVLAPYRIKNDVWVTIYCLEGVIAQAASQTIEHIDGRRIRIYGAYASLNITSVQSTSGSAGAYSLVVNVNSVSGVSVGHFVAVRAASGGTNPERLQGLFEVTNVDAVNTRLTLSSTNKVGVPSGAVTATATVLKTSLTFGGNHGLLLRYGSALGALGNLVLDGGGCTNYALQVGAPGAGRCFLTVEGDLGVWDWSSLGIYISGCSSVAGSYLCISNCGTGINVGENAELAMGYGAVSGCNYGVWVQGGGQLIGNPVKSVGNSIGVYAVNMGHAQVSASYITGFNTTDYSPAANTIGNNNSFIAVA